MTFKIQNCSKILDCFQISFLWIFVAIMVFGNDQFDNFPFFYYLFCILVGLIILSPSFSNLSHLAYLCLTNFTFQGFKKNSLFIFSIILSFEIRSIFSILFPKYDKINKTYFELCERIRFNPNSISNSIL